MQVYDDKVHGIVIPEMTTKAMADGSEMMQAIEVGRANRAALATDKDMHESHSHSVVILTCKQKNRRTGTKVGKLLLADLAGSDRVARVRQDASRRFDSGGPDSAVTTKQMQKSLQALANVIRALSSKVSVV